MKNKSKYQQERIFGEQDLPLFSQTPPTGYAEIFNPEDIIKAHQLAIIDQEQADGNDN